MKVKTLIKELYLAIIIGILLLVGSFAFFARCIDLLTYYRVHKVRFEYETETLFNDIFHQFEGLNEVSLQIASRTMIRNQLALLVNGQVDYSEAKNFIEPKLLDAVLASEEVIGVFWIGIEGSRIAVGETYYLEYANELVLNPPVLFQKNNKPILITDTPILDDFGNVVGYSYVLFDAMRITESIKAKNQYSQDVQLKVGNLLVNSSGDISYSYESEEFEEFNNEVTFLDIFQQTQWEISKINDQFGFSVRNWVNLDDLKDYESHYALFIIVFGFTSAIFLHFIIGRKLRPLRQKLVYQQEEIDSLINQHTAELSDSIKKLETTTYRDALTNVYNRNYLIHHFTDIQLLINDYQNAMIIMLDIDDFKKFNDIYGHIKGDEILKAVGMVLKASVRRQDMVIRYGGDEFLLILFGGGDIKEKQFAEKLNTTLQASFSHKIGLSCGFFRCDHCTQLEDCIKNADQRMYAEKRRNKHGHKQYS
jgi:diguanylate cyclase (GGDEF)-like protein